MLDPDQWMMDGIDDGDGNAPAAAKSMIVDRMHFAAISGLTPRAVDKAVAGGMTGVTRGAGRGSPLHFDVPVAFQWLLRQASDENGGGSLADLKRQRAAVALRKEQLAMEALERTLIPVADVVRVVQTTVAEVRDRVLSVADRIDAPQAIKEATRRECQDVVNGLVFEDWNDDDDF